MIIEYWHEMFGDYYQGEGKFSLPGFSEPLMSPHFGVTNVIGQVEKKNIAQSFKLCSFPPGQYEATHVRVETLSHAIMSRTFWEYQINYHPEAYPFLRRLLPFLVDHQKPHFCFSWIVDDEIVGTALGGEGETKCLLFNLNVRNEFRNQGVARKILQGAQSFFADKSTFYWTLHSNFTLNASLVEDYHLLKYDLSSH